MRWVVTKHKNFIYISATTSVPTKNYQVFMQMLYISIELSFLQIISERLRKLNSEGQYKTETTENRSGQTHTQHIYKQQLIQQTYKQQQH